MDAERAFEVALDHYRKGNDLLNYPVAVQMAEQALHLARAAAHFGAGNLALGLARLQAERDAAAGQQHQAGARSEPDAGALPEHDVRAG